MKEQKFNYEAPIVEVLEIQVEKGFATSAGIQGWGDGGPLEGALQQNFNMTNHF